MKSLEKKLQDRILDANNQKSLKGGMRLEIIGMGWPSDDSI